MDSERHNSVKPSHPLWLRVSHWLNAIAVVILIMSGWQIYNASPLFPFRFSPHITLGGWLGGALQWHFAALWLLFFNGLFYLVMNSVTGRFKMKYWPFSLRELFHDIRQTVMLRLDHSNLAHYNMIQKLLYIGVTVALILMVMTGLTIWKPVQFPHLRMLFGDYDMARLIHFLCMSFIAGFIAVHVALTLIVPRTLKGMILGRF
jgi:thiosulfate reductase cytochrome b subunit